MIQKYTTWWVNILLCALLIFISNIQITDGNGSSLKNSFFKKTPNNIFQTLEKSIIYLSSILEKPITYLSFMKNHCTTIYNAFYQWHEHVFYYTIDNTGNQKKCFCLRVL